MKSLLIVFVRPHYGFLALFFIISTFAISPLFAYHPLITDDTGTQGKGRYQYEFQLEYGYDEEEDIKTKELSVNNTLTYGLSDNLDMGIGLPYLYWKEENSESIDEDGFSDIEFGLKYRFYEGDGLKIAIKPSISIPTGDEERGLGAGRAGGKVFLIIDKEFKNVTLFFNAGYLRNENKIGERKNLWHISLAGEYRLSEAFKAVANVGIEQNPEKDSSEEPVFLIVGAVYSLSDSLDLSAGIKTGLTSVETDLSLMGGITWRF